MIDFKFWEDESKGIIPQDLFSETAKKIAEEINKESGGNINKLTQIRKFYDELLQFHTKIKTNPNEFGKMLPYIKMMNSKVAYAKGRKLIGDKFEKFINKGIQQIKKKEDFEVFVSLFEAFLGFYNALKKE